jgi:DNA repair protein RecN (Recombination protein N)
MLKELIVRNFAIIDFLDATFKPGLIIFTGETGAGKSIIIEALSLALGSRISPEDLRSGEGEGHVEALFDMGLEALRKKLEEHGIEAEEEELIIKRVFSSSGKSKAYINNNLVTLSVLSEIGKMLVDIHGQHQHQTLLHPENHIDIIDSYGKLLDRREGFRRKYFEYNELKNELSRLARNQRERIQKEDLIRFQIKEIDDAGLQPDEDRQLKEEKNILANAEQLFESTKECYENLYAAEGSVIEKLGRVVSILQKMSGIDPSLKENLKEGEGSLVQLEELARSLTGYEKSLEFDPGRLQAIDDRLDLLNTLKRKYGPTPEDISRFRDEIERELDGIVHYDERMKEIGNRLKEIEDDLKQEALFLSKERKEAAKKIETEVKKELKELAMGAVRFEVGFSHMPDEEGFIEAEGKKVALKDKGIDIVEFLFSPNVGEELRPLSRIASGGELSRTMLALKGILSRSDNIPVMIFDEVDAGIGGKTAEIVGLKLRRISKGHQVFCITHLPQIACQGDHHFKVEKVVKDKRTVATIRELGAKEKVEEIARMSGGKEITETTRKYARELLEKK